MGSFCKVADFTLYLLICKFVTFVRHLPKYFKYGFTLNTLYIYVLLLCIYILLYYICMCVHIHIFTYIYEYNCICFLLSRMLNSSLSTLFQSNRLVLKVVSATFLLVCFVYLKGSTCETRKNVFYFTSKVLFVLEIIRF